VVRGLVVYGHNNAYTSCEQAKYCYARVFKLRQGVRDPKP